MIRATRLSLVTFIALRLGELQAQGKGLEELSDRNPETAPSEEGDTQSADSEFTLKRDE